MARNNLEELNNMKNEDINILLFGETGVGKSTFINSFINYLQFDTFEKASNEIQDLRCLIPTKFSVVDNQLNEKIIEFGFTDDESTEAGESATLKTQSYVFDLPNYNAKVRLIDTPGICDTRGIYQDDENQKNIVNYLANLKYINAVCILLKPNQARCTVMFQHSINQLFLLLHKTAIENIIFVFTNASQSFFTQGETVHSLQKVLKDIEEKQHNKIPFNKENSFCIDNESFRYLLALRSDIRFGNEKIFSKSWSHSHGEYWRIINYVSKIRPYAVEETVYLYKIRMKFDDMCHVLTDILDLLKNDSTILKKLQEIVDTGNGVEVDDAKLHIIDVESRMSKHECNKNNILVQLSKFLTYFQTNSIILFNDYCQEYVNYLIDRENSSGSTVDRKRIRQYYDLVKYYENVKNIINMNVHLDPFSPIMTREELSSVFPQLEKEVSTLYNFANDSEVEVVINKKTVETECNKSDSNKEDTSSFNFDKWLGIIKDTANFVSDQIETTLDYENLRQQYVKEPNKTETDRYDINISSNKKSFKYDPNKKKNHRGGKSSHINKQRTNFDEASNFLNQLGTCSNNFPKDDDRNQRSRRGRSNQPRGNSNKISNNTKHKSSSSCFLDQLDVGSSKELDDFVHIENTNDNFGFVDKQQQSKSRGNFRGRGRGRGNNQQSHRGNTSKKNPSSKTHNKPQNDKSKSKASSESSNKNDVQLPKNMLQSMTNIFD